MNTFGTNLRLTTFGESHGPAIGGVIDGFPSGFKIDFEALNTEIAKRAPGGSLFVTQRRESDSPEFLSGISKDGVTLGTSIGYIIRNTDNRSNDYSELAEKYRPNHADYTYDVKYGIRDYRGGGRASARETANWVVAGALANQWLGSQGINIESELSCVGKIDFSKHLNEEFSLNPFQRLDIPDKTKAEFEQEILKAKNDGNSVGGKVTCLITGLKAGIGEPVFRKLHAQLAQAMMTINAAKAFEYGIGSDAPFLYGSECIDIFDRKETGDIYTRTNYSGGIQGGISNGMPIYFTVTLKPTPTIMKEIQTITKDGMSTTLHMKGRHDPCVAVRAVPIIKALSSLVIADFLL